jgi:hypothetical protein
VASSWLASWSHKPAGAASITIDSADTKHAYHSTKTTGMAATAAGDVAGNGRDSSMQLSAHQRLLNSHISHTSQHMDAQAGKGSGMLSEAGYARDMSLQHTQEVEVDEVGLVQPVAVVSFGCHVSSGKSFNALMCEAAGGSFVTGVCLCVCVWRAG